MNIPNSGGSGGGSNYPGSILPVDYNGEDKIPSNQKYINKKLTPSLIVNNYVSPKIIKSQITFADIFKSDKDETVHNILSEVTRHNSFDVKNIQNINLDKVKLSLTDEVLNKINNLVLENNSINPDIVINNILNKVYKGELSELKKSEIDLLPTASITKSTTSTAIPLKSSGSTSKTKVDNSRNINIQNNQTPVQAISNEDAIRLLLHKRHSLNSDDYSSETVANNINRWYIHLEDLSNQTQFTLDIKDELDILNSIGQNTDYFFEINSTPTDNLELNYDIDSNLDPYYILSIDNAPLQEQDSPHILVRNTKIKYNIVTDSSIFEANFKSSLYPYFIIYVYYNDPILAWLKQPNVTTYLTITNLSLSRFGDASLTRKIFSHLIIVPTNKFSLIPYGGRSMATTWGSRTMTIHHSLINNARNTELVNPIFDYNFNNPILNDGQYSKVPVTVNNFIPTHKDPNGTIHPKRVKSAFRSYIETINLINTNYHISNGLTYADVWTRMDNTDFYGLNFNLSTEIKDYINQGNITGVKVTGSTNNMPSRILRLKSTNIVPLPTHGIGLDL